jgi:hypothetical protein
VGTNLYAIRTIDAPFVKIGTAANVDKRVKELQTGCPFGLYVYSVRECEGVSEEKQMHRYLHKYRESGEWFRWEGEVIDLIKTWKRARNAKEVSNSSDNFARNFGSRLVELKRQNFDLSEEIDRCKEELEGLRHNDSQQCKRYSIAIRALYRMFSIPGQSNYPSTYCRITSLSHEDAIGMLLRERNVLAAMADEIDLFVKRLPPYDKMVVRRDRVNNWRDSDWLVNRALVKVPE